MKYTLDTSINATLFAPTIPVVSRPGKGGLGVAELRKTPPEDIIVTALMVPGLQPGSISVLYWDKVNVDSYVLTTTLIATGLITFNVPPGGIVDTDQAELIYEIYSPVGGNPAASLPYHVRVNTKVPGDPPLNSTEPVNSKLAPPGNIPPVITDVIAAAGINVTIAPWTYMEVGDVLTLTWGQTTLVQPPLTADQLNKPVTVFVDKATIELTRNTSGLQVFYDIRDNVGNWSLRSPPKITDVLVKDKVLPKPRVKEAINDDDIALGELGGANGHVDIPVYDNRVVGDRITLFWSGTTPGGFRVDQTVSYTVQTSDQGFDITLEIDNANIVAIAGGSASVRYEINGGERGSYSTEITVSGAVQKPPAPEVVQAHGTGQLNPEDVPATGATVSIKWSAGMLPGHRVFLYWDGTTAAGGKTHYTAEQTVTVAGQDLIFLVPKDSQVVPLSGGALELYYVITSLAGGAQRESEHRALQVTGVAPMIFPAPWISEIGEQGTQLDYKLINNDVHVIVPDYNMQIGDTVKVYWQGRVQISTAIQTVTTIGPMSFVISKYEVIDAIGSSINIWYTVKRPPSPTTHTSRIKQISVLPQDLDLSAPTINSSNTNVRVIRGNLHTGYTVQVRWIGVTTHDTETKVLASEAELDFTIPTAWANENMGKEVRINYSVHLPGDARARFSRLLRVVIATAVSGVEDWLRYPPKTMPYNEPTVFPTGIKMTVLGGTWPSQVLGTSVTSCAYYSGARSQTKIEFGGPIRNLEFTSRGSRSPNAIAIFAKDGHSLGIQNLPLSNNPTTVSFHVAESIDYAIVSNVEFFNDGIFFCKLVWS